MKILNKIMKILNKIFCKHKWKFVRRGRGSFKAVYVCECVYCGKKIMLCKNCSQNPKPTGGKK